MSRFFLSALLLSLAGCGASEDKTDNPSDTGSTETGETASETVDADGDGFNKGEDCDDNNPVLGNIANDATCDGVEDVITADGIDLMAVPAGTFEMGCTTAQQNDGNCAADESPAHDVTLHGCVPGFSTRVAERKIEKGKTWYTTFFDDVPARAENDRRNARLFKVSGNQTHGLMTDGSKGYEQSGVYLVLAHPGFYLRSVLGQGEALAEIGRHPIEARAQRAYQALFGQFAQTGDRQVGLRVLGVGGFLVPRLVGEQRIEVRVGGHKQLVFPR